MNVFKSLLQELHKKDKVHPSMLHKANFVYSFNDATNLVTQCLMIIVQGSKRIHVGMEKRRKIERKTYKSEDVMSRFYLCHHLFCPKNSKSTSTFLSTNHGLLGVNLT